MQRRSFAMWTAAALWVSATANAAATPGQGRWEGHAVMAGSTLPLVLDLERVADGRWTGSVTLPGRGVKGAPLADLQVDARGARFSLGAAFLSPSEPPPAATLRWRGRERASGTLTVNGVAAPLTLQRSGAAQVDRPLRSTPIDDALVGTWVGRYELGGHPRDVTLTLRRDAEGLGNGQRSTRQGVAETLTDDALHRDEHGAVDLADVVDERNVRVGYRRSGPRLAQEPASSFLVLHLIGVKQLERDAAAKDLVLRCVDDAHAAPADLLADLVAVDA